MMNNIAGTNNPCLTSCSSSSSSSSIPPLRVHLLIFKLPLHFHHLLITIFFSLRSFCILGGRRFRNPPALLADCLYVYKYFNYPNFNFLRALNSESAQLEGSQSGQRDNCIKEQDYGHATLSPGGIPWGIKFN